MLFINKRGAMFGLDARIALAIFGALSVISGAALYSAIQQAKVVSNIAIVNELEKAYEHYFIEKGYLAQHPTALYYLRVITLSEEGYTSLPCTVHPTRLDQGDTTLRIYEYEEDATNTETGIKQNTVCTWSDTCYTWIRLLKLDKEIAEGIDLKVDGEVDWATGRVRIDDLDLGGGTHKYDIYYKSFVSKRY